MEIIAEGSVLVLRGDFDVRSTAAVREAIDACLEATPGDVVLDLTGVTAIDLTALRVVVGATRRADRTGRRLVLRGCGPSVRRMLHLSRLARAVEVERTAVPV